MTKAELHSKMIALGPGPYFLIQIWLEILAGQAADVIRLANATAISKPTVRKYLSKLAALGYVVPAGAERWQLAGLVQQDGFIVEGAAGTLAPVIDLPAETPEPEKKNFSLLEEEDVNNNQKPLNTSSSSDDGAKKFFLEKSDLIFGACVVSHGLVLDALSADDILGWLAEAYDTRKKLANPPGLVYQRLRAGAEAHEKYRLDPGKYLPENYLQAIGRADLIPACERCGAYPCQCPPPMPPAQDVIEYFDPEPSARVQESWGGSWTPQRAWAAAKEQIRLEMPKAAFETWVRDVVLIDADQERSEFTLGFCNSSARDWVADRLQNTILRLLTGIMNQSEISLTFEVVG